MIFRFPPFEKKSVPRSERVLVGDQEIFIPSDLHQNHGQLLLKIKMGGRFDSMDQQLKDNFLFEVQTIFSQKSLELPDNYWDIFYYYVQNLE